MCASRTTRFFRRWSAAEDPEQLLDPQNQWSTPWGAPDHGPCDKCEGAGTIDRTKRRGVSVFPTVDGLYRYIAERDAGPDDCVIELEGELTGDRDLDALLVRPTRIVALHSFDRARLQALRTTVSR